MINLSDEETSNHVDSDIVFKSSTAATTPQDGSLMGSLGPSSIQGSIELVPTHKLEHTWFIFILVKGSWLYYHTAL